MEAKSVGKVGVLVVLAVIAFIGSYIYLSHINLNTYTVRVAFEDTQAVAKQSVVRMQGVAIGEVTKIELDTTKRPPLPVVTLAIDKKYPLPADSKFTVVSGLLITNPQIVVVPGSDPAFLAEGGPPLRGERPAGPLASISPELPKTLQTLNAELPKTIAKLNDSFTNLNEKFNVAAGKINVLLDNANRLTTTATQTIGGAKNIIADPQLKLKLVATLDNFKKVSQSAAVASKQLTGDLQDILKSGKGAIGKLPARLDEILTRISGTIDTANTVVEKLTEQVTDPRFQQSLQETTELARATLARFNQIAADLHEISGDPNLRSDLKGIVANLKDTTARLSPVVEKVDNLLGKVSGGTSKVRAPQINLVGNVSEQFDPARLRVDLDAQIGLGPRGFLDLGLYDLGQDTRLNLQLGNRLSPALTARYGLYASKLGIGADYQATPNLAFRADLWDTRRTRLDTKALFRVNKEASLWVGADGIFHRPVPIVGIQIQR